MAKESPQPLLFQGSTGPGLPTYTPHYQTIVIPGRVEPVRYRRSPLRRFIVAFLVAVGLFSVVKAIVRFHIHPTHWRHRWDLPENMVIDRCTGGSAWAVADAAVLSDTPGAFVSAAQATFEIPLNDDTVLVLSRHSKPSYFGSRTPLSGSLSVTTSSRLNNTARIVVTALHGPHKPKRTGLQACLMSGPDGEAGVGILTRRRFSGDGTFVKVQLVLPDGAEPLHLKGLTTNLPNFSVDVSLRGSNGRVHVKSLLAGDAELHTSNGAISADALNATTLTLRTSNSGISGSYNTSGTLTLTTSNAPIDVSVGLASDDDSRATKVIMRTSNNRLTARITLATEGDFGVIGTTSNGVLSITGASAPSGAALDLSARTSNARAEVTLPDTYEGAFTLHTSNHAPEVVERHKDDGRTVEYQSKKNPTVKGWVYAEEKNRDLGRVMVMTSNAPVTLFV
ncbi:hypothetical protein FB451DRAFT_1379206 [Mycena latifolia]|nr:hypothetical protein FB451DRAFT_1379206 [Mycena latifolia]